MQEENKVKKSFHQNMKSELKKVVWPTGKQVLKSTFATIGFVLLISITLIILNYAFSFLNTKWYDLVLGNKTSVDNQVEQISDVSGDTDKLNDEINLESENENIEEFSGESLAE